MSDNDLIRRGEVLAKAHHHPVDGGLIISAYDVKNIHAVPQEMSAREYLETEARVCKYYGLPCAFDVSGMTVDEAIKMVEKFAREHPGKGAEHEGSCSL